MMHHIWFFPNPLGMDRVTYIQNASCQSLAGYLTGIRVECIWTGFAFWVNRAAELAGSEEALGWLLSVAGTLQVCELTERLMDLLKFVCAAAKGPSYN